MSTAFLSRSRFGVFARLVVAISMLATIVGVVAPPQASAAAAWDMTVSRITASPQYTGLPTLFRIQIQCSAIDEARCYDTEIRWPGDDPNTFTYQYHPVIESLTYDGVADEWVLDLRDSIRAGGSIELGIRGEVATSLTPDGETVTIDATITSSNTGSVSASASGVWQASADLTVAKFTMFGVDAAGVPRDMLLDTPVRYYLRPCDPVLIANQDAPPGHLFPVDMTMVDTLPANVVFEDAGNGGIYDPVAHTVTWTDAGPVETTDCGFGVSDWWVEVTFPSTHFGLNDVAQNHVTIQGYPLGAPQDATTLLQDNDTINHSFVPAGAAGDVSKNAVTPYFDKADYTYAGDEARWELSGRRLAGHSQPTYLEIIDPLPCLTNDLADGDPLTVPNQYWSLDVGAGVCTEPAVVPTRISVQPWGFRDGYYVYPSTTEEYWDEWVPATPIIPVRFTTNAGTTGVLDAVNQGSYAWLVDEVELAAKLPAGERYAELRWDMRDIGLQLAPGGMAWPFRFYIDADVVEDTAAYPMVDQTRVWNKASLNFYDDPTEPPIHVNTGQDEVVIIPPQPALKVTKSYNETAGYFMLQGEIAGPGLADGEQLVLTDLLPVGYTFHSVQQLRINNSDGFWRFWRQTRDATNVNPTGTLAPLNPMDYAQVEVIDDYAGSGRQLVRLTLDEPPYPEGWYDGRTAVDFWFAFYVNPATLSLPTLNTVQIFPTDPASNANLWCSAAGSSYDTINYPPFANDPLDLDGDGETALDSYCEASVSVLGEPGSVQLISEKGVQGDLDAGVESFPHVGAITAAGGTGRFRIDIANPGDTAVDNVVVYDVLPHVGDTALTESLGGAARGSQWDAVFAGIDVATLPAGAQVEYSASTTPCRTELATSGTSPWPAGCTDDWSTGLPAGGVSAVKALRITFVDDSGGLLELDPGESFEIDYEVTYPAGLNPGDIAFNSFAFAGTRVDDGSAFLPTEPPKVGLAIPAVDLEVTKSSNSQAFLVDAPREYTITIDHAGSISDAGVYTGPVGTAYNVELIDDAVAQGLTIVPGSWVLRNTGNGLTGGGSFDPATGQILIDEIGPNDKFVLTYEAYASTPGRYTNTVEIVDVPGIVDIDSTPGNGVDTEDDQASVDRLWVTADIDLQKLVEDSPGSGVFIEADSSDGLVGTYRADEPVTYRFVVENTGTTRLSNVELVDPLIGFDCDQTIGVLNAGASTTIDCVYSTGFSSGPVTNTATVTGDLSGVRNWVPVSDSDDATVEIVDLFDLALVVEPAAGQADHVGWNTTTLELDVTVRNQGDLSPDDVVTVTPYVPAGMTLDVAATTAANSGNANVSVNADGTVDIATLDPRDTEVFTYVLSSDDTATTGVVETLGHRGLVSVVFGAEISDDSAPAGSSDHDSTPDGVDTDTIYDAEDSHNEIAHFDPLWDHRSEDEDDHDREEITADPALGSIGDFVWNDADGDGVQDAGETGIGNVTVTLDPGTPGDTSDDVTTTTDANGAYLFDDLVSGDYTVTFTPPAGMIVSPSDAGSDDAADSDGASVDVTLGLGEDNHRVDLGLYPGASVGDFVWEDADGDGVQDAGETGVAGIVVTLDPGTPGDTSDDVTTVTDANGAYLFDDLAPGDYRVIFDLPDNMVGSPVDAGSDDEADSDGLSVDVTLGIGDTDDSIDLGVYPGASIGDLVWSDTDRDGVQDPGETGIVGVTVTLDPGTPGDTSDDLTTVTGADGEYLFAHLDPGTYTVTFSPPAGMVVSPTDAGSDDDVDSDGVEVTVTVAGGDQVRDIDLGLYAGASVGDLVWFDTDRDGVQDPGETGIAGVTVTLDPNTPGDTSDDLTTVTDADGEYVFDTLAPGDYTVTFTPPAGMVVSPTDAGSDDGADSDGVSVDVTLAMGDTDLSIDLGLYDGASIGDLVWEDTDGDGIQDPGEAGIAGVTVTLDPNTPGDTSDDLTTVTDADGEYVFDTLAPGTYTVTIDPGTYSFTTTGAGSDPEADSNGAATTVTVTMGEDVTEVDAGLVDLASIGDLVWEDTDGDGIQDPGEPGIDGVTVTLDPGTPGDTSDDVTTTTDASGNYLFDDLVPGTYTVTVDPGAYTFTTTGAGSDPEADSNGGSTTVTVDSGDDVTEVDAGLVELGSIGDLVWEDTDGDGIQDPGEPGISGVSVTLDPGTPGDTSDDTTVQTDASGNYLFDDLVPGVYTVTVDPGAWSFTATGAGSDPEADSNGAATTVTVESGDTITEIDAGLFELASIGDLVWEDADGDGVQDGGETGIDGVTVTLDPGTPGDTSDDVATVTAGGGLYSFGGLVPGDYTVTFTQPAGTVVSPTDTGADDAVDSDGLSVDVTLGSGQDDTSIDLGVYAPVSVGDLVWDDTDGDGIQDPGEPGIDGVTVTLDPGTAGDTSDDVTTVTAGGGLYNFTGLVPGTYTVSVTLPANTMASPANAGSDPGVDSEPTSATVVLAPGTNDATIDFGVITLASVGDLVWHDLDGDGVQDPGEPGISGATVTLDPGTPGDTSDDLVAMTDANGAWSVVDVAPATYTVTVVVPDATMIASPVGAGSDPEADSNGATSTVVVEPGDVITEVDAGFYNLASVGDTVWHDTDGDGVQDPGEPGIAGITVTLDPATPGDTSDDVTTTTDSDGEYLFTDLVPGAYTVTFTPDPADGWWISPTNTGSDTSVDSNGLSTTATLVSGEDDRDLDLGLFLAVSIGDFVWDDLDADGVQDPGEPGIARVVVTLDPDTPGDTSDDTTTSTDASGNYSFDDLVPGSYTVTFTQPGATSVSPTGAGSDTTTDSNGLSATVTLDSGETDQTLDLGVFSAGEVSGQVWLDADVDGEQESGESARAGVTVTLDPATPGDTSDDLTTVTDAAGAYRFTGLAPGSYTVNIVAPADTVVTVPGAAPAPVNNDGTSTDVVVESGRAVTDIDLGLVELASVSGTVYHDLDLSMTHTAGDAGIGGVTVTLSGTDVFGTAVNVTATTDADGDYSFDGLVPGTYTLVQTQPAAFVTHGETVGSLGGTASTNTIADVVVGAGAAGVDYDFGEVVLGSIAGTVFVDDALDASFDGTEATLVGVTVTLSGTDTFNNPVTAATATTGADGSYVFTGLVPGTYTVTETQPVAYLDGLATSAGSEGGTFGSTMISGINLGSGVAATRYDFGEITPSTDVALIKTATPDPTQPGATVTFTLNYSNTGNVTVADATLTETVPVGATLGTNTDAWSCATGDPAGTVCTLALGDLAVGASGTAAFVVVVDSPLADPTQTSLPNTAVLAGTGQNPDGSETPVSTSDSADPVIDSTFVEGTVYLQTPGGDQPLAGATVALLNSTGTPVINPATGAGWATTVGADGAYRFAGLAPGTYTVAETTPAGYGDAAGHNANVTLDVPLGGARQDFWHTTGSIAGTIWADTTRNDTLDPGEQPLAGVTVTLSGTDANGDPVSATTTTAADGTYSFDALLAGTYTVTEAQPSQFANGTTIAGSSGGATTGTDDTTADIALGAGVDATGYDFNETGTTVSGSVFIDGTNTPIPGVTVTLTGTDIFNNPVTATATTNTDGDYEFTDVLPGTYTLVETQPAGLGDGIVETDNTIDISVAASPVENADFSEVAAVLTGSVIHDLDHAGADPADPGIAGVTITLTGTDINATPVSMTTTTDANGDYQFRDLIAGTYTVVETQPGEYANGTTTPGTAGGTTTGTDDTIDAVTLDAGETITNYDYTEITHPISGTVYVHGTNTPVPGTTIELIDTTGTTIATTTTDGDGNYTFPNVAIGTYTVVETQPSGYDSHTPNTMTVDHGDTPTGDIDFVETTATIAGTVYIDDTNQPLEGVTVTLTGTDINGDPVERTTITDTDGNYTFTDVLAGDYTLVETQPDDYLNGTVEPDNEIPINIDPGAAIEDQDFSERLANSTISGTVYEDGTNQPIPGVTITLTWPDDTTQTTTTGPDGTYRFNRLPEGTYTVVETQPGGYDPGTVNPNNQITLTLDENDERDGVDFSERLPAPRTGRTDTPWPTSGGGVPPTTQPPSPDPKPQPTLAFTGQTTQTLTALAATLLLTGTALLITNRRRNQHP